MPPLFRFISQNFWLLAILTTVVNAHLFRRRAQKYIDQDPSLEAGYDTLFRGYLTWLNAPWVIMGIGCTVGGVPSVWHYFRLKDGNPYVLAWLGSVFLLYLLGTYWLFFRQGAEMLAKHPGAIEFAYGFKRRDLTSPTAIKIFWLFALAGGIAGVCFLWYANPPLPEFH